MSNQQEVTQSSATTMLSPAEWQVLARKLETHGRCLDQILPVLYAGKALSVPEKVRCPKCSTQLGRKLFIAILQEIDGRRPGVKLEAYAKCPSCGSPMLHRYIYTASHARQTPESSSLFSLVALARRISRNRGESDADRAKPLFHRICARVNGLGHLGTLAAFLIFSAELHMPDQVAQWSLSLFWPALLKGFSLGYRLWALYEIGVLWASSTHSTKGEPQ